MRGVSRERWFQFIPFIQALYLWRNGSEVAVMNFLLLNRVGRMKKGGGNGAS